jgi:antitoxin component of MazEF toxin-antitoxin module
MPVTKKLTRIGNSLGVILPQAALQQMDLTAESEVELEINGKTLTIRPHIYAGNPEFQAAKAKVFLKRRKMLERLAK